MIQNKNLVVFTDIENEEEEEACCICLQSPIYKPTQVNHSAVNVNVLVCNI